MSSIDLRLQQSRAFASIESHLSQSIVISDAPTSLVLKSLQRIQSHNILDDVQQSFSQGLSFLIHECRSSNVIALDDAIERCSKDSSLTQTRIKQKQTTSSETQQTPSKHAINPSFNDISVPSESLASPGGWNNDIDFIDADNNPADPSDSESKSTEAAAASTEEKTSAFSSNEQSIASTDSHSGSNPTRAVHYHPLDFSHGSVVESDILEDVRGQAPSEPRSPTKSSKSPKKKSQKGDEWGWNDEEEDDGDDAANESRLENPFSKLRVNNIADPPAVSPSKACFLLSTPLVPALQSHIASILISQHRHKAQEARSSSRGAWKEIHIFCTSKSKSGGTPEQDQELFETIKQNIHQLIKKELPSDTPVIDIHIHYFPLSFSLVSDDMFLTPLSAARKTNTDAQGKNSTSTLSTYPPSLHINSSLLSSLIQPKTSPAPNAAHASKPSESSSSSLLSGFSISNIAKGLSDHIKEAEAIAMAGASATDEHAIGAEGEAHAAAAANHDAQTSSGPSKSLRKSLALSLANALFSMRVLPDVFALGEHTSDLAKDTLNQLQVLKRKQTAIETAAIAEYETNAKKKKPSKRITASTTATAPTLSTWNHASLLLLDRSLDLLTVTQHHSVAGLLDRLNDDSLHSSATAPTQPSHGHKNADQIAKNLLSSFDSALATLEEGSSAPSQTPSASDDISMAQLRNVIFSHAPTSEKVLTLSSLSEVACAFPQAFREQSAQTLIDALQELARDTPVDAPPPSHKTVLTLLYEHVAATAGSLGILPPEDFPASTPELVSEIARMLAGIQKAEYGVRIQNQEFLSLAQAILHSFAPPSSGASKSLYDKLAALEQLLILQYTNNTTALAQGSFAASTNPNEDENSLAIKGLIAPIVEFVQQVGSNKKDSSENEKKSSIKTKKGDKSKSSTGTSEEHLSICDLIRLFIFLFSLVGGKRLIPESEASKLKQLLTQFIQHASSTDRNWLRDICGLASASDLSSEYVQSLVQALFRQLQGVSLARSNLSASDLIDLCAPLDSASDSESASRNISFVERLFTRIEHPDCLLDDLEHIPFEDDDDDEEAEEKKKKQEEKDGHDSSSSNATESGIAGKKGRNASDALSSLASREPEPAQSGGSGWSFLGSLAAVVTSVAKTAPLHRLGFSSVARPEQRKNMLLYMVGGITRSESQAILDYMQKWNEREKENVPSSPQDESSPASMQRSLLVGSTHVATAKDVVKQLLSAAATDVTATSQ